MQPAPSSVILSLSITIPSASLVMLAVKVYVILSTVVIGAVDGSIEPSALM